MLKQRLHKLTAFGLLFVAISSPLVLADFEYSGQGQLFDQSGQPQNFQFGFAYIQQDGQYHFKAGQLSIVTEDVPSRYTIELVLNNQEQVWISDFSKQPLVGFNWLIGEHRLELKKESAPKPLAGKFKLTIDKTEYFFTSKHRGQIHFKFTEQGISSIEVGSMMTRKR